MSNFTTWRSLVDGEEIDEIPDIAIHHWDFEGASASGTAPDLIGDADLDLNGEEVSTHDGRSDAFRTEGLNGPSNWDDPDHGYTNGISLSGGYTFSIELWFWFDSSQPGSSPRGAPTLTTDIPGNSRDGIITRDVGDHRWEGDNSDNWRIETNDNRNEWVHHVLVSDGDDAIVYTNGSEDERTSLSDYNEETDQWTDFSVGNGPGTADGIAGWFDNIIIYDDALSQSEVLERYEATNY